MNETEWVEIVAKQLRSSFGDDEKILIETQRKLAYAYEILSYDENWEIKSGKPTLYTTDLLISEKANDEIKPRVVIEAKILGVTTHDAITYSQKAMTHKSVHPYLRYGIMLGGMKVSPLPGRLIRHGSNFDFMISFSDFELSLNELKKLSSIIRSQISVSRELEGMLYQSRLSSRKRYLVVEKELLLSELVD
jgi:hypothetical protein